MKECWINVYERNLNSINHPTKNNAILASLYMKSSGASSTIYRIHVKMKPIKQNMKLFGINIPGVYAGDGKFNWME